MANEEHLAQLMLGTDHWNRWRKENWIIKPDLSGINLSGWDLKGIFLSKSDLRSVNFTNTNLSKANINQAILDNAILNGANLSQTGLSGINLQSTIFGNANLEQALLSCSNLIGVDLSKVNLQRANLQGAELNHANLKGVDISFSNLSLAKLKCTDFRNAKLFAANLYEADLREADLRGTNLDHADLRRSFLHKTQIDQTTSLAEKWLFVWKVVNQKIKINNLHGADLREVNLSGADLSRVDLSAANLIDANLSDVNFRKANLDRANLQSAKLTGAILLETSLREANLMFADLSNANLAGIDISGTLFRTDLKGADLFRACLFQAYLFRANLFRVNLKEANIRQANLTKANLLRADLSSACLEQANLTEANLVGADLSNACLEQANLTLVQAIDTDFTQARLTGVCLQDWNINNMTKLDGVVCEYVYKQRNQQERRPRTGNFAPGEFITLSQKVIETVDLIFIDGIDWKAFFQSFQELQMQHGETNISIQGIEKKSGDAFVIRLEVSPQTDKAAIERQAKELYETKLQLKLHQIQMQAKDKEIVLYQEQLNVQRQQNTELIGIVKTMADKEPTNKTTIHTSNIGFVNSGSGTVSNFSQNIGQNFDEISKLIVSLREIAEKFPETQRQEAMELLEHLQEDIAKPEKQKSGRIKASIITLLTIAGVVAGATDFANNLFELSEKLGIPIDVNVPQLIQHSPVLKPNQL